MSKSVEEIRKSSRRVAWLFVGFGVFFLGLLILFIYTTSRVEPVVIVVLGGPAILMFLMASLLPRITIGALEREDGWQRVDSVFWMVEILLYAHEIVIYLNFILNILLYWYDDSHKFVPNFYFEQFIHVAMLVALLMLHIRSLAIIKIYKGFQSKTFPDLTEKNIGLPARLLENHGIQFRSIGPVKVTRWNTFNEVLEFQNGVHLRIRHPKKVSNWVAWAHPETGFKFGVEMGPINDANRNFIQEIKKIMDHLDEE